MHIPASPVAPHMVDNKYYGPGDKTKYQLGDAEVVSLHARRRSAEADTLTLLRAEMDNDPLRNVDDQSHLFLVARPAAARRDVCLPITGAPDWQTRLTGLVTKARTSESLPTALTRFELATVPAPLHCPPVNAPDSPPGVHMPGPGDAHSVAGPRPAVAAQWQFPPGRQGPHLP
ncbi:hypothetical protein [Streptomyces bacillaris]|uniref:hypothetical protein n=1 Tax=Streptomyces bacillaris TaxID=68179 RepID=UPI0038208D95